MICPKCKKEAPSEASYCPYCGRLIGAIRRKKTKRPDGMGYAYQRGSTWTIRVSMGFRTDEDGNRHRIQLTRGGFRSKQDAQAYAETLKNGDFTASDISLDSLFAKWSESYSGRVGASTMAGYKAAFKHFSSLAPRMMSTIRPAELQAQIDSCKKGKRTKQMMKVTAGLLWKYALDNDIVTKNAAANLYTGNDATGTHAPFTDLEMRKIWNVVDTEPYAPYVLALCYTGFRPGELLALEKTAVNLRDRYVVGGGKTETGTDRIVTIPPVAMDIFRNRARADGQYLFPNLATGRKMSHEYFRKLCFDPLMERLGITDRVPYSCRHTYSNLLKGIRGDTGDKARLMGHTDYTFTQERYQSSTVEDLRKLTNKIKRPANL